MTTPDTLQLRENNIELRRTMSRGPNARPYLEIVKWEGQTCYTVASWAGIKDELDLHFIAGRPFDLNEQEQATFWHLAQVGHRLLES